MVIHMGRVFNPYIPWGDASEPINTSPNPRSLAVLSIEEPIQQAYTRDLSQALNDTCGCEEADLSPPPSPFLSFASDSPLSMPPLSHPSSHLLPTVTPPIPTMASTSSTSCEAPSFIPNPPGTGSLSDRSKAGKVACQAHKHAQAENAAAIGGYKACSSLSKKWFLTSIIHCVPSESPLTLACGAYVGIKCSRHEKLYTVDELLAKGLRLISWDGVMPIALVDRDGCVVVMLTGWR